jgi:hypothetical protein
VNHRCFVAREHPFIVWRDGEPRCFYCRELASSPVPTVPTVTDTAWFTLGLVGTVLVWWVALRR